MKLEELQRHWNEFGKRDPLWAILTVPQKRNRQWRLDEFFRTGEEEIAQVLAYVDSLGVARPRRRALDFGCGVGRLTQALCAHFESCNGVDIAPSMIELARSYNTHGDRCRYHLNAASDLSLFESGTFDFIFTTRVLQHMRPEYSTSYLREFLRVLAPGGVAVFQIPSHPEAANAEAPDVTATPLPDTGFRAEIRPRAASLQAAVRSSLALQVGVKNASDVVWPAGGLSSGGQAIYLGNHWLTPAGKVVIADDGRALLREDLAPGQEVELSIVINTPAGAGSYLLELDLVQQGVAWFGNKGSQPARVDVRLLHDVPFFRRLLRKLGAGQGGEAEVVPIMEMYGVPQEAIAALVAEAGGQVLDVRPDHIAGEGWRSFQYCVQKRQAGAPGPPRP